MERMLTEAIWHVNQHGIASKVRFGVSTDVFASDIQKMHSLSKLTGLRDVVKRYEKAEERAKSKAGLMHIYFWMWD
jgi:hypothetical protein